ncbi:hypothetical protein ACSBR2_020101 [Camellia fascicularis]
MLWQSEYVSERSKRREFVSGFTGSAGLALISMNEALLWTDGRYFLQAALELSDQWKLMRMGGGPAVDIWMADGSRIIEVVVARVVGAGAEATITRIHI